MLTSIFTIQALTPAFFQGKAINTGEGYYDIKLGPTIREATRVNTLFSRVRQDEKLKDLEGVSGSFQKIIADHFTLKSVNE